MKRRISIEQYRDIDLTIFLLILLVIEYVVQRAAGSWYPGELYTVSVTASVTGIVMMRWGSFGAIHAVAGAVVYVLATGGGAKQLIVYCIGNLFSLFMLFFFRNDGKKKIKDNILLTLLYAVGVQILMQTGRGLVAMPLFGTGIETVSKFILIDALSTLFTGVVICIAGRLDGVFEDQRAYLERMNQERKDQEG